MPQTLAAPGPILRALDTRHKPVPSALPGPPPRTGSCRPMPLLSVPRQLLRRVQTGTCNQGVASPLCISVALLCQVPGRLAAWAYTRGTARPLHVSRGLALRSGSCSPCHLKWYIVSSRGAFGLGPVAREIRALRISHVALHCQPTERGPPRKLHPDSRFGWCSGRHSFCGACSLRPVGKQQ